MRQDPAHAQVVVELVVGLAVEDVAVDLRFNDRRPLGKRDRFDRGVRQSETGRGVIGHDDGRGRLDHQGDNRGCKAAKNAETCPAKADHPPELLPAQCAVDQLSSTSSRTLMPAVMSGALLMARGSAG